MLCFNFALSLFRKRFFCIMSTLFFFSVMKPFCLLPWLFDRILRGGSSYSLIHSTSKSSNNTKNKSFLKKPSAHTIMLNSPVIPQNGRKIRFMETKYGIIYCI